MDLLDEEMYHSKTISQITQQMFNIKAFNPKYIKIRRTDKYDYVIHFNKMYTNYVFKIINSDEFQNLVIFMYSNGYDYDILKSKKGSWCVVWKK